MKITKKKQKRLDRDTQMTIAVTEVASCSERGGRGGSLCIGDIDPEAKARMDRARHIADAGGPRGSAMVGERHVDLDDLPHPPQRLKLQRQGE